MTSLQRMAVGRIQALIRATDIELPSRGSATLYSAEDIVKLDQASSERWTRNHANAQEILQWTEALLEEKDDTDG